MDVNFEMTGRGINKQFCHYYNFIASVHKYTAQSYRDHHQCHVSGSLGATFGIELNFKH